MYTADFGLREEPFSAAPEDRFVYVGTPHARALAHLLEGVQAQEGIMHLTGASGTGKTTVRGLLVDRLGERVNVALIPDPAITPEELLATICRKLGAKEESHRLSRRKLTDLADVLHHLLIAHAHGRRTVLIIDEAQGLRAAVFEQLRLLTNLEADGQKLLRVILIGQPELLRVLERSNLPKPAEPSASGCRLLPFDEGETSTYVRHRLAVAGGIRDIFEIEALREVHRLSGGAPRRINVICDFALRCAHGARRTTVDQSTVRAAAREVAKVARMTRPAAPTTRRMFRIGR